MHEASMVDFGIGGITGRVAKSPPSLRVSVPLSANFSWTDPRGLVDDPVLLGRNGFAEGDKYPHMAGRSLHGTKGLVKCDRFARRGAPSFLASCFTENVPGTNVRAQGESVT